MKKATTFLLIFLATQAFASVDNIMQVTGQYGWVKPGTEVIYKKNACENNVYDSGYAFVGSFEQANDAAYQDQYQGGTCSVTETPSSTVAATFPSNYDYQTYLSSDPSRKGVTTYQYQCVDNNAEAYTFEYELQPMYVCKDGGCDEEYTHCIGDVLARRLDEPVIGSFGHTGLYGKKNVVEVLDEHEVIQVNSFKSFVDKTKYWGAAYGASSKTELDYQEGQDLITAGLAQRAFFPEYTLLPMYREGHYVFQQGKQNYQKGIFRCDTFVQYTYKKVLDVKLPPLHDNELPKDQFKSIPHKRVGTIENVFPENQVLAPDSVSSIFTNEHLLDADKATQLRALYDKTQDKKQRYLVYDAMRFIITEPNIPFLLKAYQHTSDTKTKLLILSALRYHYVYFQDQHPHKILQGQLNEIKAIYQKILEHDQNIDLKRRAIEDVTLVFEPEEAYRLLKKVDLKVPAYKEPYLTAMAVTTLNTHRDHELFTLVQNMNACELEDREALFQHAYDNHLISEHELMNLQGMRLHKSHAPNCTHDLT